MTKSKNTMGDSTAENRNRNHHNFLQPASCARGDLNGILKSAKHRRQLYFLARPSRQSMSNKRDRIKIAVERTKRTYSMVANTSKRYTRAAGFSWSPSMNSNAPLSRSGSARPRSVFNAEITDNQGLSAFIVATGALMLTAVRCGELVRKH